MIREYIATHGGTFQAAFRHFFHRVTHSDFARKVSETYLTRIVLIALGLVSSVIVARSLGPEGRGLLSVAAVLGAIGAQFGNLGLHTSNTYSVARDKSLLPVLTGNSLVVSFGFGGLGALVALCFFWMRPETAPIQGWLLFMALAIVPFSLASMFLQNLLIGIQKIRVYNKIELATKIFAMALILAVVAGHLATVEVLFLTGFVSMGVGLIWNFRELKNHWRGPLAISWSVFRENFFYGLRSYLACFFAYLVLDIDLLMVKYLSGAEQAGYYSIASDMTDRVFLISGIVGTILFPKLSALKGKAEKWEMTRKATFVVGTFLFFLSAGSAAIAKLVLGLLYGKAFLPAVSSFVCLMPGAFFWGISTFPLLYLSSTGLPMQVVWGWAFLTVVNVSLNFFFIPAMGGMGAAIVSTITYGLGFLIFQVYAWKLSRD